MKDFSKIVIGTMSWGNWGKQFSKSEMINLMQFCVNQGLTTFDHADIYGGYTTEIDFGHAFSKSGIASEDIQLISKCGIQYISENRNNTIKHYDYSKDYIIWSVENSLKNLQTDYLDLFLLHRPSLLMQPEEIAEAIVKLKKEGKIKAFGVSNFSRAQIELIASEIPLEVNQIECSLTQHDAMHTGILDFMVKEQIASMAWSPLGSVFKEQTKQTQRVHVCLESLTKKYDTTKDTLVLAWLLKHPAKIFPVIGTTNTARISNALKATEINLELEDWFKLLAASQGHKVP